MQQFGAPNFDVSDSDSDTRNGGSVYGSPSIWARIHTLYYRCISCYAGFMTVLLA